MANGIVSWVMHQQIGYYFLVNPPQSVISILLVDQLGVSRPRLVPNVIM